MARRVLCWVVPLFSVALLMFPGVASANGPGGAAAPSPMVEVEFIAKSAEAGPEDLIIVPNLPTKSREILRQEREYYESMYELAWTMCDSTAKTTEFTTSTSVVGFTKEVVEFNTVRHQLNKLLHRYRLGFAPNLEDLSETDGLEIIRAAPHGKLIRQEAGITTVAGNTLCTFRML